MDSFGSCIENEDPFLGIPYAGDEELNNLEYKPTLLDDTFRTFSLLPSTSEEDYFWEDDTVVEAGHNNLTPPLRYDDNLEDVHFPRHTGSDARVHTTTYDSKYLNSYIPDTPESYASDFDPYDASRYAYSSNNFENTTDLETDDLERAVIEAARATDPDVVGNKIAVQKESKTKSKHLREEAASSKKDNQTVQRERSRLGLKFICGLAIYNCPCGELPVKGFYAFASEYFIEKSMKEESWKSSVRNVLARKDYFDWKNDFNTLRDGVWRFHANGKKMFFDDLRKHCRKFTDRGKYGLKDPRVWKDMCHGKLGIPYFDPFPATKQPYRTTVVIPILPPPPMKKLMFPVKTITVPRPTVRQVPSGVDSYPTLRAMLNSKGPIVHRQLAGAPIPPQGIFAQCPPMPSAAPTLPVTRVVKIVSGTILIIQGAPTSPGKTPRMRFKLAPPPAPKPVPPPPRVIMKPKP